MRDVAVECVRGLNEVFDSRFGLRAREVEGLKDAVVWVLVDLLLLMQASNLVVVRISFFFWWNFFKYIIVTSPRSTEQIIKPPRYPPKQPKISAERKPATPLPDNPPGKFYIFLTFDALVVVPLPLPLADRFRLEALTGFFPFNSNTFFNPVGIASVERVEAWTHLKRGGVYTVVDLVIVDDFLVFFLLGMVDGVVLVAETLRVADGVEPCGSYLMTRCSAQ